jgi:HPt (histidine-containing phosphotransfer) domain-containing protein
MSPLLVTVPADRMTALDAGTILDLVQDMPGQDVATLFDTFARDSRRRVQAMARALETGEKAALPRLAHALAGSAAAIGAARLEALARAAERAPPQAPAELAPLHEATEQAIAALLALRAE